MKTVRKITFAFAAFMAVALATGCQPKQVSPQLAWNQSFNVLNVGDVVPIKYTSLNSDIDPVFEYDSKIINVAKSNSNGGWEIITLARGTTNLSMYIPETEGFLKSETITKEILVDRKKDYHVDLWVALDKHGGMARDVQTLVRSMDNLEAGQPEITFVGKGTEVNSILSLETIYKGAFYYQVPVSGDRFAKYVIKDNKIEAIAERPFKANSYATRKYTHAWLGDNTLLIMAASGDMTSILWTKLNTDDMSIISEGTLNVPLPEKAKVFTTSGIASYRKSDNKLFYFYYGKSSSGRTGVRTSPFYVAAINPETMAVESNEVNSCGVGEMAGSAYGELLQTITFIDSDNNLYLSAFSDETDGYERETSFMIRIPNGKTNFDKDYNGFSVDGKLISIMYLGNGKGIAYARNDELGTGIDAFSHYYSVIDVNAGTISPLKYDGKELGYSSGRFSSRMDSREGLAYIGVDPQGSNPQIYIYDVDSGNVTKGATMAKGYYFEHIRILDNYNK